VDVAPEYPLPTAYAALTFKWQGHPDRPKELPVSQRLYTESTRFMPRGGVVLPSIGRAHDLCASEQNWKPGWRRE
jgi:hypothetical protein